MVRRFHILFLVGLMMVSCSPRALHEAQCVVAHADSMRAEGRMYDDSLALAQACGTLGQWSWYHADEYAHSCYHYGRLLREKDNPVEAMQCFINASHTPTRDYHILGRVYSNMGSICHLAGDFPLSYEMYAHSADMFLRAGDSTAYFYALNDMAFELAEQGKEEETIHLIDAITGTCSDSDVRSLTTLAKVTLYDHIGQYDSVLIYLNQAPEISVYATSKVLKARAFEHTGQIDSALWYAEEVLSMSSAAEQDRYNALYIVLNYDSALQNEDLIALSAQRSDIETDVLIPLHNQWAVAVQLLEQDLARKPNMAWLYAIIVTLFVVGVGLFIYVHRKHKKQELLAQKLDMLQQATTTMQERHDELATNYMNNHRHIIEEMNNKCSVLRNNDKIYTTLAWKNYHKMCSAVDKQFYLLASKLRSKQCLNETEIRLCVLTLLDCGYEQMAELLFRSTTSIGTLKIRVARKLGTSSKNLRQYLIDNECLK